MIIRELDHHFRIPTYLRVGTTHFGQAEYQIWYLETTQPCEATPQEPFAFDARLRVITLPGTKSVPLLDEDFTQPPTLHFLAPRTLIEILAGQWSIGVEVTPAGVVLSGRWRFKVCGSCLNTTPWSEA
jgi:hypothetical protein